MRGRPPLNAALTTDAQGNITSTAWREYFSGEQNHYDQVDKWVDPTFPDFGKVEPPANIRRVGLKTYANGTDWNPGSGAGWYYWNGSGWTLYAS